ncbi:MAG: hypothetical protein ABIU09_11240 [Pyrinomonadaceae bacterium]
MSERDFDKTLAQDGPDGNEPKILINEIGEAVDPTVVVDEANRTVLLTDTETIIIEKEHLIDIAPKNRPRKVYTGMWGPIEIATAGAGMLAIVAAILLYVFVVVPSNRELEDNRARLVTLENELISTREKYGNISNVETEVAKLLSSVNDFESNYLPIAANGRTALYQRINGLITGYGLVNTTGPDYAPLDIVEQKEAGKANEEGGKSKFRSLFPGVYVTTTVEGPYVNLRRFIRELETGREFVVVSAVELEPSDTEQKDVRQNRPTQAGLPADPTAGYSMSNTAGAFPPEAKTTLPSSNRGKTHGSTVRLRLEMAAYFRRPNAVMPEAFPQ